MKTKTTLLLLPVFIFFFRMEITRAQTISASLREMVSGSGIGASVSPQLALNTERQSFSAGINIQNRSNNISGLRGNYSFTINPGDAAEIFLFYDIGWHYNALLGNYVVHQESSLNPEFSDYYAGARIKTLEQHIGFGMNKYITGPLQLFFSAGAGYYTTLNCPQQNLFWFREKNNFSLLLSAGIKINIKRFN
ncbi:MAG: hypothetical protein HY063_03140 [Bacteroidetes bacterium]|nr:hypothetical protein [Bacteroidota bacterium]